MSNNSNNTATESKRVFDFEVPAKPAKQQRNKAIVVQSNTSDHPYEIGEVYLIRTVTMIDTGRIKSVHPNEIVLTEASWIPDTGRFADCLKKCEFNEVEPFPDGEVIIGRGSIIDAVRIQRSPRTQK